MPQRDILIIGIRIGALVIFLNTLLQVPQFAFTLASWASEEGDLWKLAMPWGLAIVLVSAASAWLWFKPQSILSGGKTAEAGEEIKAAGSFEDLHFTLVSAIGLFFLVTGLVRMSDFGLRVVMDWLSADTDVHTASWSFYIGDAVRIGLGLYLVTGAQSIVRAIRKLRRL